MEPRHEQAGRRPVDGRARERLREAQRREARALQAVAKADDSLMAKRLRWQQTCNAAERAVAEALRARDLAVAALAEVSGLDRAALLLSETPASVRRARRSAADGTR